MKTRFQANRLNRKCEPRTRTLGRLATATILVAVALVAFNIGKPSAGAEELNSCKESAAKALGSCDDGAEGNYKLALGKCENLSGSDAQTHCENQAAADFKDALQLCNDQNDLRQIVCKRLGGAPYGPNIIPSNFVTVIDNPYFPLKPGTTFVYEGQTQEGFEHVEFAVTRKTRVILGVACVEVHDVRRLNNKVVEDTRDWFAQDKQGNVWYFGENTTLVESGLPVDLSGSWTAGVNGAQPGIIMKAHPVVGDFYRQEFSLANAEDLAEVKSLTAHATVPYGSFNNCLKTLESSPLAPGDLENKFYVTGVGNVLTIDLAGRERSELVQIKTN
jgi:hypothetical protein